MRPQDFKRWRKALSFSQKEAAEALGLKRRVVQYYEKGERGGAKVKIPKTVRLACGALSKGLTDYQGPEKVAEAKTGKKGIAKPADAKAKAKGGKKPAYPVARKSAPKSAGKPARRKAAVRKGA